MAAVSYPLLRFARRLTAVAFLAAAAAPVPSIGSAAESFLSRNPKVPDAVVYGRDGMATPAATGTPPPGPAGAAPTPATPSSDGIERPAPASR